MSTLAGPAARSFNKNKRTVKMSQATKLLVLVLTVTWVSGCASSATSPVESPEYCTVDYEAQLPEIRRIALVATSEPTTIETVTLGHTRGEGAAGGAAAGAVGGVEIAGEIVSSSGSDPYALLLGLLLLPVLVVVGAAGGAVFGTVTGHSPDTLAEAEANAQAIIDSANLHTQILEKAQDYGLANFDLEFIRIPIVGSESRVESQTYSGLPDESIDAVLEVELVRISLKSTLEMEARSRLVSSRTGDVLNENKHVFKSESRSLNEWTENNAAQVSEEIQWGLTVIAEDIVDEDFSLFPRKERNGQFASNDPEKLINQDTIIRRFSTLPNSGKLGSKFSSDLLNIPEGKSAIFIYRPKSFLDPDVTVPVMIKDKYLSKLPKHGFDCLIIDPGMNTMAYPSKLTSPLASSEEIAIVRESVETNINEIAYFSVRVSPGIITAPVSVESETEKDAVDSLRANRRGEIQVINQD